MDKVHIIVNPFSAQGKTEKRWKIIKEVITHYFKEFKYIFTEKPKQATEIARSLLKEGYDLIIGVGGDGTLNEITNGFFNKNSSTTINQEAALGIIPSGTGSDFTRSIRLPRDFTKSVKLIKNSKSKKIDIGKITFYNLKDKQKNYKYFINVSDFGLGADVIKNLSSIPPLKRGAFAYYKGMLLTLKRYKSKNVKMIIDNSYEINNKFLIVAIANGRIFGGGMIIAPEAKLDDGYFDVILIEDMKKLEIIKNSRHLYTGSIKKNPKVTIIKAKNIKVYSDEEVNIEYDGEAGETLPAEFELIEKVINFRL